MRANFAVLGVLIPAVGVLQLVPGTAPENPAVLHEQTIEARLTVPDSISGTLKQSCGDCHSNETKWPWYARIAPMSWLVAKDVERGRAAMNFSDWPSKKGASIGQLMAVCADVKGERMPPQSYRVMHPETGLNDDQVDDLCGWTMEQSKALSKRHSKASLSK